MQTAREIVLELEELLYLKNYSMDLWVKEESGENVTDETPVVITIFGPDDNQLYKDNIPFSQMIPTFEYLTVMVYNHFI